MPRAVFFFAGRGLSSPVTGDLPDDFTRFVSGRVLYFRTLSSFIPEIRVFGEIVPFVRGSVIDV